MLKAKLCGKCAELLNDSYLVRRVEVGADKKVSFDNCAHCAKRRYCGTYWLEPKSKKQA